MVKWHPTISLKGVGKFDGKVGLPAELELLSEDAELILKVHVPYDPEQSVRSVREAVAARAIEVLLQAAADLAASSPREIEERDRDILRDDYDFLEP